MVQADDAIKRRVHRGTTRRVATNPKALETATGFPLPGNVLDLSNIGQDIGGVLTNITGSGALYVNAGGANQNIHLVPSGTGQVRADDVGAIWLEAINTGSVDILVAGAAPNAPSIYMDNSGGYLSGTPWQIYGGAVRIGGTLAANGINISAPGVVTLVGAARVYNNLRIWPASVRLPAANFPAGGTASVFDVLDFDDGIEESCFVDIILPYRREAGTDVTVSVYWHSAAAIAGDCIWGIEYNAIADSDAVGGATTTVEQAFTTDGTAGDLSIDTFTTKILAANIDDKDIMGIRLYRKAADALDTLAGDARCLGLNLEFTSDKLGKAI